MSFDPKKQPQKVDDNWLSLALIHKIEPCNLFHCDAGTYLFANSWKLLDAIDLKNRVR